ncbi:uncharacterized protein LOC110452651 [Mizuhopecten yessoensis]|uniref:uncharacterized protein LOC110452651 n=1 Tax=Mizuhopecten yessoensis TaxID=6573 RepID=UPI000B45CE25|nr:uncharacterized protein LOC110452651 [Mizuhopecten yessoensis]
MLKGLSYLGWRVVRLMTMKGSLVVRLAKFMIFLGTSLLLFVFYQVHRYSGQLNFTGVAEAPRVGGHSRGYDLQMKFLVDTPHCKLPNLDPFDSSVVKYLRQGAFIKCDRYLPLTYANGTRLEINWTAIIHSKDRHYFSFCKYQPIHRPPFVERNNYYNYLEESAAFNTSQIMRYDFVRVRCYNRGGGLMYTNFHQFVRPKPKLDRKCKRTFQKHRQETGVKESLNVAMIGVDSVSRLNFMRYMRRTKDYLENTLGAIEMKGYNKVADNTFVNIVPMTLGKFLEEVPWNETLNDIPFDKYDFIWKQFSNRGFRTLYAEDQPAIAIFDYLKEGFHQQPADYFNRHFSLAMTKQKRLWYNEGKCVGTKLETQIMLDYVKDFMLMYKNRPHFAFAFITGLTHNVLEHTAVADLPYRTLLADLQESGALNKTAVIFYSDHGIRFGKIRETYVGKLEERLPFMYVILPKWFLEKYPNITKNLKINSNRLTTPFDIYETLRNILNFTGETRTVPAEQRGVSLFDEVPFLRSCQTAGILPHWCTCPIHQTMSTSHPQVQNIAVNIVLSINKQLDGYSSMCAYLNLDIVLNATKLIPSDKVLRFEQSKNDVINRHVKYGERAKAYVDFQLTLRARPGGGLFEATVRFDERRDEYQMLSDVSRINLYGDQSKCIEKHKLKKYCYCTNP